MRRSMSGGSVLMVGLVLAVGTGIVFYFLTSVQSILAFVAGLQVTLLTVQIESILHERRREADQSRQDRIVRDINAIDWMPAVVENIVSSSTLVAQRYPGTMIALQNRRLLESSASELAHFEHGHIWFDYEHVGPLLENASRAQASIRSTSLQEVDLEWWLSPLGQRYWQTTIHAMARGVHCERIFIYSSWPDQLDQLARTQADAGLHVLRVRRDDLPAQLRIDMIVWDEFCGYETRLNERGEGQRNFFTLRPEEIARMIDTYNAIYKWATDFPERQPPCVLH
jgi:hypothetical protein